MKMNELVEIVPGTSVTRINETSNGRNYFIYNQTSFTDDQLMKKSDNVKFNSVITEKNTKLQMTETGDLILNMATSEVAVVSENYTDFILPYNYSKLIVNDPSRLDKKYLEFWINQSSQFNNQIQSDSSGKSTKRITVNKFKELDIELPELEVQKKSGELYSAIKELTALRRRKADIYNKLLAQKAFVEVEANE